MYTIMGATGQTGGAVARTLLNRGHAIRAVGRSAERLAPLAAIGAELAIGDANDPTFLTNAFDGANGVYAMVAPAVTTTDMIGDFERGAAAIATATARAGTPRLVVLSGIGAHYDTGVGPAVGLHRLEQAVASTGAHQTHLRPAYYFENFFLSLPTIYATGSNVGPIDPDVAVT
ncbi:MAG TPA: NAD(P)H-binding protein, partial [Nocardioides sp.]|nr:NAD(P)H-binding protein [Nocardioides sp.]